MADRLVREATEGRTDGDRVAIVILSRDRRDLLLDCLETVNRLTYAPHATVLVDNGSRDGTPDEVARRWPDIHLLRQPENLGVAGGRNLGLAWSIANLDPAYVLFLDDDALIEPEALGELVRTAAADPGIGLVAPKAYRRPGERTLVSAGGMRFSPWLGEAVDVAAGQEDVGGYDTPADIQACPGFAFFVRREVFASVGDFDEGYNPYGFEDVDFSLRAARAGFRVVYAPDAVVHHRGGRAGRGPNLAYERHKARALLRLMRKHSTPLQFGCALTLLPFRAVRRIARELGSGNAAVVRSWVAGAFRSAR